MLSIGMIGPPLLLQQNRRIFQQRDTEAFPLRTAQQLQKIDGLLITGCRPEDYACQLYRLRTSIKCCADSFALFGIAAGAAALGQNQLLPLLNCRTYCQKASAFTTSLLDVPCFQKSRFAAFFQPKICFADLAPSLGILCHHPLHGPVIIRQGDILACSYLAEWTEPKEIYQYWLEMVETLKNSREI